MDIEHLQDLAKAADKRVAAVFNTLRTGDIVNANLEQQLADARAALSILSDELAAAKSAER